MGVCGCVCGWVRVCGCVRACVYLRVWRVCGIACVVHVWVCVCVWVGVWVCVCMCGACLYVCVCERVCVGAWEWVCVLARACASLCGCACEYVCGCVCGVACVYMYMGVCARAYDRERVSERQRKCVCVSVGAVYQKNVSTFFINKSTRSLGKDLNKLISKKGKVTFIVSHATHFAKPDEHIWLNILVAFRCTTTPSFLQCLLVNSLSLYT